MDSIHLYTGAIKNIIFRASLVVQWLRSACQRRGHEFHPRTGEISYTTKQRSLCTTTTEPALRAVLCSKGSPQEEKRKEGGRGVLGAGKWPAGTNLQT